MAQIRAGQSVPGWIAWILLMIVVCSNQSDTKRVEQKVDDLTESVSEIRELLKPPVDSSLFDVDSAAGDVW